MLIKTAKLLDKLRKKLKGGKSIISGWMQLSNTNLTELICQAKFDCITFDLEHGAFSVKDLPDLFRVVEMNEKLPFVRLPNKNIKISSQCLDAGAAGIIIPNIRDNIELEKIIKSINLPPFGNRGVGYSRVNRFGKYFKNFVNTKKKPFIVAMIENINSVKNLNKILSVRGLDSILIGPYDLSASMKITGKFENIKFNKIINEIKLKAKKFKVPCGIHVVETNYKKLKEYEKKGFKFLPYGIDTEIFNKSINKIFKI